MKSICVALIAISLLIVPALGYELQQSFRGDGAWSTELKSDTIKSEMSGLGSMSYAISGTITTEGAKIKTGIEFDGTRGVVKIGSILGDKLNYGFRANEVTNMSVRSDIDTITKEETQDSTIGKLLLYNVALDGSIKGKMIETIDSGNNIMGRPIGVSRLTGEDGIFVFNTSVNLNEYES